MKANDARAMVRTGGDAVAVVESRMVVAVVAKVLRDG